MHEDAQVKDRGPFVDIETFPWWLEAIGLLLEPEGAEQRSICSSEKLSARALVAAPRPTGANTAYGDGQRVKCSH